MLEDVDTRVMLLELPTTKMFGWQWGDVKNVVLSLPSTNCAAISIAMLVAILRT